MKNFTLVVHFWLNPRDANLNRTRKNSWKLGKTHKISKFQISEFFKLSQFSHVQSGVESYFA